MTSTTPKKVRVPDLALMKQRGDRIVMLTAYTMARLLDRAGIDLLVGDSLGKCDHGIGDNDPSHSRQVDDPSHCRQVEFTFSWKREKRWEGRNFRVEVFENAAGEESTPAQSTENVPLNEVSNRSNKRPLQCTNLESNEDE
jgi:hypothetical protein